MEQAILIFYNYEPLGHMQQERDLQCIGCTLNCVVLVMVLVSGVVSLRELGREELIISEIGQFKQTAANPISLVPRLSPLCDHLISQVR